MNEILGSRVYLAKTGLAEDLIISWTTITREPQPQDKIILHTGNQFQTEAAMPSQNLDFGSADELQNLEQECLGPFSIEWIDKDGNLMAAGCMETNPKWMEKMQLSTKAFTLQDLILTGTHYSGMFHKKYLKKRKRRKIKKIENFPLNPS